MKSENGQATTQNNDVPWKELDEPTRQFYLRALDLMDQTGVKYCVAGAYALAAHAGIVRHTKDLDVFLKREDVEQVMKAFESIGCRTERTHPHWLAKAFADDPKDAFVDLIFRAASGIWQVDDDWVNHSKSGPVVGRDAPLCPAEELIWSKAMVMERHRFDGADIAHVIHATGKTLDWDRLIRRATGHEGVLLGHLVFYRYIYPCDPQNVPNEVLERLFAKVRDQKPLPEELCRGTLVSWEQYLPDINERGLIDGRLRPWGELTEEEIRRWTEADK
ncbi:MAG TPA: hypothetical protein VF669_18445 [Tepidisphaeraceae bacterium]|jgi:hypothetical protein